MLKKLIVALALSVISFSAGAQGSTTKETMVYINQQCSNVGNITAFLEKSRRDVDDPKATITDMGDAFLEVLQNKTPNMSKSELEQHRVRVNAAIRLWNSHWMTLVALSPDNLVGYSIGVCVQSGIEKFVLKQ